MQIFSAEHFAESLVETGSDLGVDEFLLVQWIAPLASESPELMVACLLAWRLKGGDALGALLSSKVNQWTLLIGGLPIVFALTHVGLDGLPVDAEQRYELLITGAQSLLAIALLVTLRDEPIWSMTIPGKVQSYLASGRPLLGMFNGEGGRVIREAEAGMTAPAGDYRTLADNVRTMMHMSREERAELGRNGRAYAQAHFNRAALIASLEEWIVELGDKTTAERQHA